MQPSLWTQAFRGFDEMDEVAKQQLVLQYFQGAAPLLQSAQIVPLNKDDEIQLRGMYSGYPTRIVCDPFFDLAIDVKAECHTHASLSFRFDPESAPRPGDVDPWDEDDDVRVFLARCVFVEDGASDIDDTLRRIGALPIDFRQHLYTLMQNNDLSSFNLTGNGPGCSFRRDMGTMWDPMLQLQQVLWLLAYGASVYAAIAAQPAAQGYSAQPGHPSQHGYAPQAGHAALLRAQCRYCSTIYVVDPTPACPNCGAPYTG